MHICNEKPGHRDARARRDVAVVIDGEHRCGSGWERLWLD
jgi:hypothetical protein